MNNRNIYISGCIFDEPLAQVLWTYFNNTEECEIMSFGRIDIDFSQGDFNGIGEEYGFECKEMSRFRDSDIVNWLKECLLCGESCSFTINNEFYSFYSDDEAIRKIFKLLDSAEESIQQEAADYEMKYRYWKQDGFCAEWEQLQRYMPQTDGFWIRRDGDPKLMQDVADDEDLTEICCNDGYCFTRWVSNGEEVETDWGELFEGDEAIIPEGVRRIEGETMDYFDLSNVETLVIPKSFKYTIGMDLSLMSSLKKVVVQGDIKYIEKGTFTNCGSIEIIELPNGLEYIQPGSFEECSNLRTIIIPDSVKCIHESLFDNCPQLDEDTKQSIRAKEKISGDEPFGEEIVKQIREWESKYMDYAIFYNE